VSPLGYALWSELGTWVGLSPSVGKTYYTEEFAQINSRNFLYDSKTGRYRPVFILNMGMLVGIAKKGGDVSTMRRAERVSQTACNYRSLMEDCLTISQKERVHSLFMELHGEFLRSFRLPWYVPCWAGGLGLTGYILPDDKDRRCMRMVRMCYSKLRPKSLPLGEKTWLVHQIATRHLPVTSLFVDQTVGVKEFQAAVALKSVDMLFDASVPFAKMFQSGALSDLAAKNLAHNDRLWSKLRKSPSLPVPLSYEEAVSITYHEGWNCVIAEPWSDDLVVVVPETRVLVLEDRVPEGWVINE